MSSAAGGGGRGVEREETVVGGGGGTADSRRKSRETIGGGGGKGKPVFETIDLDLEEGDEEINLSQLGGGGEKVPLPFLEEEDDVEEASVFQTALGKLRERFRHRYEAQTVESQKENRTLRGQIRSLEGKLVEAGLDNENLRRKLGEETLKVEELEVASKAVVEENAELKRKLGEVTEENGELNGTVGELALENDGLKAKLGKERDLVKSMKAACRTVLGQLGLVKGIVGGSEKILSRLIPGEGESASTSRQRTSSGDIQGTSTAQTSFTSDPGNQSNNGNVGLGSMEQDEEFHGTTHGMVKDVGEQQLANYNGGGGHGATTPPPAESQRSPSPSPNDSFWQRLGLQMTPRNRRALKARILADRLRSGQASGLRRLRKRPGRRPAPVPDTRRHLGAGEFRSPQAGESQGRNRRQSRPRTLVSHGVDESRTEEGYFCYCGMKCQDRASLNRHIRYYTEEWKFRCEDCGKFFFSTNYLRRHMICVHSKVLPAGLVGCCACGQIFPSHADMFRHRKTTDCGTVPLSESQQE